ncbi:MAG: Holliday junction branch migration protein RuvA, partial [Oscillospiraceae bacterium]
GERYAGGGVTVIPQNKASEAGAALAVLGYGPADISAALRGIDMENLPLEDIIRQALKGMMK